MGGFSTPQQLMPLDFSNGESPHVSSAPKEVILEEGIS